MNKRLKNMVKANSISERTRERKVYGKHGMAQRKDIAVYYDINCRPKGYSKLRHNQWLAHLLWANPDKRKCPNTNMARQLNRAIRQTQ